MALIRVAADMLHLAAILVLLAKMLKTRSAAGISLKSMKLFALVFITRYLDVFVSFISLYNTAMKIFLILSTCHICYLMMFRAPWKSTYDAVNDTFRLHFLIVPCIVLALVFHSSTRKGLVLNVFWSFSQYLEAVAILPQIFHLEYTQRYDALTAHYLFLLGAYRVFYLIHWIVRYLSVGLINHISVFAGIVQSLMYVDFFYNYLVQVVRRARQSYDLAQ